MRVVFVERRQVDDDHVRKEGRVKGGSVALVIRVPKRPIPPRMRLVRKKRRRVRFDSELKESIDVGYRIRTGGHQLIEMVGI